MRIKSTPIRNAIVIPATAGQHEHVRLLNIPIPRKAENSECPKNDSSSSATIGVSFPDLLRSVCSCNERESDLSDLTGFALYAMHDVFGCPRRAYPFQLSNVHRNDCTLRFPDYALAEAKKLAKWPDLPETAVRGWQMPVIIIDVPHTAWLPLLRLEPRSAAQANPESTDP